MQQTIENETSLETYLRKQREKRKETKNAKKKQIENTSDGRFFSNFLPVIIFLYKNYSYILKIDDNLGRNLDNLHLINSNISKPKSKNSPKFSKEHKEADRQKAELELLVMDDEKEVHKHFDLKEIIQNEKRKNKKKKIKKDSIQDDDDFEINVNDSRFAALHESHHFAIDPSNPQYPLLNFYIFKFFFSFLK